MEEMVVFVERSLKKEDKIRTTLYLTSTLPVLCNGVDVWCSVVSLVCKLAS